MKQGFGQFIFVASLKLKAFFEQPQIHTRYRVALKNYHQRLKCTTTWFTSIDCQSTMHSNKNLIKAVKWLPEILCKSFYKATKDFSFVSGDVKLIKCERWLGNRLKKCMNHIGNSIAKQEEKSKFPPYKPNTNTGTIDRKSTHKQINK